MGALLNAAGSEYGFRTGCDHISSGDVRDSDDRMNTGSRRRNVRRLRVGTITAGRKRKDTAALAAQKTMVCSIESKSKI